MNKRKKLSVIVPVYNVEKYLNQCLDSLVNQTIEDYEVIVVNDGTKDNSQKIIDSYADKYPEIIKSYIKENGGLGDARNYGIRFATGEYLTFLDSDDYVEHDLYKNMYDLAHNNNYDLVVADLEYFWEDNSKDSYTNSGLNIVSNDNIKNLFLSPLFSWNKMYRKDLFDKLNCQYPIRTWYEDIPVTLKYFSNIKSVGYYKGKAYHYRQRNDSILGSKYDDRMYDIFKIFSSVIKDFKENNKYNYFYDELEYLYIEHFLFYGAFRFLRTDHYKELMTKAFDFVINEFPNYKKNKYLKTIGLKNIIFVLTNNNRTMSLWHWYLTK